MPDDIPHPPETDRAQARPAMDASAQALREHILLRFRRCGAGLADQALRSAVLAYLLGAKK